MNRIRVAKIYLLFMFSAVSCQFNSNCSNMAECLSDLHRRTVSTPGWEESDTDLLNDRLFLRLYASADEKFNELTGVIHSDASEDVKLLAVLVAQGLESDKYVDFAEAVLNAKFSDNASDKLIAYSVYPGSSWGTGLVELVDRPKVQAILESAEQSATSDVLVDRIKAIRDGSYRRYLDHLRERGDIVPTVSAKLDELELK